MYTHVCVYYAALVNIYSYYKQSNLFLVVYHPMLLILTLAHLYDCFLWSFTYNYYT